MSATYLLEEWIDEINCSLSATYLLEEWIDEINCSLSATYLLEEWIDDINTCKDVFCTELDYGDFDPFFKVTGWMDG